MKRPWSSLTVVALLALQGCYINAPLQTSVPPTGKTVVLQISDQGRVSLGERLGPGVSQIQGRVTSVVEQQVAINVASVGYISGERSLWGGESVSLSRDFVSSIQIRKLSKSRTWIAVGATTVAVGAFMASRGLLAFFTNISDGGGPEPEPPASLRLNFGFHF